MEHVSIMLCAYNAEKYIRDAIESMLNQTYQNTDIIMVNDGSTDHTLDIMKTYKDRHIKIVETSHDYIRSLNIGLSHCRGEFIARMDADDIMEENRIEEQVYYMHHNLDMTACFSWTTAFGDNNGLYGNHVQGWIPIPYFWLLTGNFLQHPTAMIRKEFLRLHRIRYKYYPFAEDYKLWVDLAKHKAKFYVIPKPLLLHRLNGDQVSRKFANEQWQTRLHIQQEIIEGLLPMVHLAHRKRILSFYRNMLALNESSLIQGDRVVEQMYQILNQLRKQGLLIMQQ